MKKNIFITLTVIALSLFLVGCSKTKTSNPLVGKWEHGSFIYTFNKDMTMTYDASGTLMKGTYKVNGNKLSILYNGDTVSFDTTFKIDEDKLSIKDSFGEDVIYTKK